MELTQYTLKVGALSLGITISSFQKLMPVHLLLQILKFFIASGKFVGNMERKYMNKIRRNYYKTTVFFALQVIC